MTRSIALFVGKDWIGLNLVNSLVQVFAQDGYHVTLFDCGSRPNRRFQHPSPPEWRFYNVTLLETVAEPLLRSYPHPPGHFDDTLLLLPDLAKIYACGYHLIDDVNDERTQSLVAEQDKGTLFLSLRMLQIFSPSTIAHVNAKGSLYNLHGGILPEYRGLLIPVHAILNGSATYGATLHAITPGIDQGGIIDQRTLPLDCGKPVMKLYEDLQKPSIDMIVSAVRGDGLSPCLDMTSDNLSTYYSYPTQDQLDRFYTNGGELIGPRLDFVQRMALSLAGPNNHLRQLLLESLSMAAVSFEKGGQIQTSSSAPQRAPVYEAG